CATKVGRARNRFPAALAPGQSRVSEGAVAPASGPALGDRHLPPPRIGPYSARDAPRRCKSLPTPRGTLPTKEILPPSGPVKPELRGRAAPRPPGVPWSGTAIRDYSDSRLTQIWRARSRPRQPADS